MRVGKPVAPKVPKGFTCTNCYECDLENMVVFDKGYCYCEKCWDIVLEFLSTQIFYESFELWKRLKGY
jgi:hypothetical protein